LLALAVWQLGGGAAIHAKAVLAQHLLDRAWQRTLDGEPQARPWGWADTWPVARLRVERLGIDQVVLAGASGSSLAFGPGHLDGTVLPGQAGNAVVGGHRDTHFRFLADLVPGDELVVDDASGGEHHFVVTDARVVDSRSSGVSLASAKPALTLVTCYPFDAVIPGGSQRYVVLAEPVECDDALTDTTGCG
jgi:sortase A